MNPLFVALLKRFIISHTTNIQSKMSDLKYFFGGVGTYLFTYINLTEALQNTNLFFSSVGSLASTFLICAKIAEKYGWSLKKKK
jgi:hypothetical protein